MINKKILSLCILLGMLTSCGKYGYDFEDGYQVGDESGSGKDSTMSYIDKTMYDKARIYPGMVGDNVKRIQDTSVTLPLNFRLVNRNDLKVNSAPGAIFSTGLYAPAGENIKINVPEGVLGITAQIGVHMDDLSGVDPLRRQPIIYTVKELTKGDNYIRNPFGGTIWIKASISQSGPTALRFSGAVRSPDYIHGVTDHNAWIKDVESTEVPWLELRAKRVIFSVPRSFVLNSKSRLDVGKALAEWNTVYEKDYYEWMGLREGNTDRKNAFPELPERGVLDIQPRVGYAHSSGGDGIPWVATQDQYWFDTFTNYDNIAGELGAWGTYHEIGHNYQQGQAWSWSALGETTNNLFVFKAAQRYNNLNVATHPSLEENFRKGVEYTRSTGTKNFNVLSEIPEGGRPFFRLLPFLQIFNKSKGKNGEPGWDFMTYVYTQARNSNISFALDQAKIDFFYRSLCDFTGLDYARFFSSWGIPVSNAARREMRTKYDPLDKALWTYNPSTNTGGEDALPTKYDLSNMLFTYKPNAQTATNEGAANTLAALNDGNFVTFWHTCWSGCPVPTLPVQIDVDLKGVEAYKGFYYGNRNHSMYNKHIRLYKSNDGENWTLLGDYPNQPDVRGQRIEIPFDQIHESRYIRVEFPSYGNNSSHVAVSEIGLFYDI